MENKIKVKIAQPLSQIRVGAILSYILIVLNIVSGVIYVPWMINIIGDSNFGLYTLAISVVSFFVLDFGISQSISKFISRYRSEGKEDQVNKFLGITYKLYLIIDIVIFFILVIIWLYSESIFVKLNADELAKLKNIFLIAGVTSVIAFPFLTLNSILTSYERFIFLKACALINKALIILLTILFLVLGYGLYTLILVNSAVNILIIFIKLIYINKRIGIKVDYKIKNKLLVKQIFSFSIWITIINIAQRLTLNIAPSILAIFSNTIEPSSTEITYFSLGLTIEGFVWSFAYALNGLFLPKVTNLIVKQKDNSKLLSLMIRVGRLQFLIIGLIIMGFSLMGKEFILLWMGEGYIKSYYVGILLIIPQIIFLTQEIARTALIVVDEVKYRAFVYIGGTILSLVLSIVLSPKYGAIGTAFAIFISHIFTDTIAMNIIYKKILKIDMKQFYKKSYFELLLPFLICSPIIIFMQNYFPTNNILVFLGKVIFIGVIYFILLWISALNKNEKNEFIHIIKTLFKKATKILKINKG